MQFFDVITAQDLGLNHFQLIYRVTPSKQREFILQRIKLVLQKIVDISGLKSVCLHPDIFIVNNKIKIIEINVKIGGFSCDLSELSLGVNLNKIIVSLALGKPITEKIKFTKNICGVEVWSQKSGTIKSLTIPKSKFIIRSRKYKQNFLNYIAPPYAQKPLARFFVEDKRHRLIRQAKRLRKKVVIEWQTFN